MLDRTAQRNSPEEVLVEQIEREAKKISTSIVIGGEEHHVWMEASESLFPETDFLLPIALLPAMRAGMTLKLPGKVSPRLLSSLPQIQDILSMWESVFKHVPVEAEARNTVAERGLGVACFFGGGIDAFHTLLRHREEISHLVYIHTLTEDRSIMETSVQRVREVARRLDKTVIEVESNLHDFERQRGIPFKYSHGTRIASVGLLFQHIFARVLIPGSTTSNYDNLRPQGTHPILDPLWGTELTDFYHDGCEMRRVEKAAYIADDEVAMDWLQVCDIGKGAYNCGRCEKCLRTMLNLKAAGALERCRTLASEINLQAVADMDLSSYSASYFARENLRALERLGTEPELVQALAEALDRGGQIIAHSGYSEERADNLNKRNQKLVEKNGKLRSTNSELRSTNAKLRASGKRLEKQKQKLATENSRLTTRYSRRRYRLVDRVVESVCRIPGVAWLLQRQS